MHDQTHSPARQSPVYVRQRSRWAQPAIRRLDGAIMVNQRRRPASAQFGDDLGDDVGQFIDSVDQLPQFEDGSARRAGSQFS